MLRKIREMLTCHKGFTLVELMAVVAIIGVLAAIAIPRYVDATDNATAGKILADLRIIDSAIAMSNAAGNGLATITIANLVSGGYLRETPATPSWGGTYGITAADGTPPFSASYTGAHGTVYSSSTLAQIRAAK